MSRVKAMYWAVVVSLTALSLVYIPQTETVNDILYSPKEMYEVSVCDLSIDEPRHPFDIYSDYELELLTRVTYAEAGNQSEMGKRLVIDTVLNRIEDSRFKGSSIEEILFAPKQFDTVTSGQIWRYSWHDDVYQLVLDEICMRTNTDVIAFRTGHYHNWATPAFKEGAHYFSM